jgi:hypothetical protein
VSEPFRPTRLEVLRTRAPGGVVTASQLLNGSGVGAQTVISAPPPAGLSGARMMFIRPGEGPPASGRSRGVDEDGEPDIDSLTVRGWIRAGALFELFARATGAPCPGLARPTAIYAASDTAGEGSRTLQTVTPLAAHLGVPVNTQFGKGDETALARELVSHSEPSLICWRHGELPVIATALAAVAPTPPTSWPEDCYDLVWTWTQPQEVGHSTKSPPTHRRRGRQRSVDGIADDSIPPRSEVRPMAPSSSGTVECTVTRDAGRGPCVTTRLVTPDGSWSVAPLVPPRPERSPTKRLPFDPAAGPGSPNRSVGGHPT